MIEPFFDKRDAEALCTVLGMAENSPIWNEPCVDPEMQQFRDQQYEAIQRVRAFLKDHGVVTFHELLQRATEEYQTRTLTRPGIDDDINKGYRP
jgi:hypothetical protein